MQGRSLSLICQKNGEMKELEPGVLENARLSDASRLTDTAGFRGECLAVGAYNVISQAKKGCTLMCILSRSALFFHPETGFQKLSPQPAHKEGGVR